MPSPNVYAVQLDIVWEDKAANFRKVEDLVAATAPVAGSLVILSEMFACGFSMNLTVTRQSDEHEDETFLANLARKHGVYVSGAAAT